MASAGESRATLEQVARAAGVSKATASKVLNRRPNISAETRRRVEEAIERLGYVPSTGPRLPAQLNTVSVVFDTLVNVYSMQVLDGILAASHTYTVEVLVDVLEPGGLRPDGPFTTRWIQRLAARGQTGVIVVTSELTSDQRQRMRDAGLSVVVIDPLNPLDDEVASVGSTNYTGGMQATRHLLDLGHRRIAYAGGIAASGASRERLQGFLSALASEGITPDAGLVLEEGFSFDSGLKMGMRLLSMPDPPTAIFAGCDAAALGTLEAARRHDLRVPEDLSVVGFDDTYSALSTAPPLTTIRQPIIDMGRVALRILLQQARGERPDSHHIQLATRLVIRESTTAPGRTSPESPA